MKTPASKTGTTFVPVVTIEEAPILSEGERQDLIASLKEAEADIAAGRTTVFNREGFLKEFFAICRGETD